MAGAAAANRDVVRIGTAGWAIPHAVDARFPGEGSHLRRYAARFPAAEINSSFHRPHRPSTYERWAASVPEGFRFAAKLPKQITHERRLIDTVDLLEAFLAQAGALGPKLGVLLVQLPPSLQFQADIADRFFGALRDRHAGDIACEPRHASWFIDEADEHLGRFGVARAAADPARVPRAAEPGGSRRMIYYRLHGSPRMYYSAYDDDTLDRLAGRLSCLPKGCRQAWCIFDNTTLGAATANAVALLERMGR